MSTLDRRRGGVVELRPVDRDLFRCLLRRRASTVTVVTAPGLAGGRHLPSLPPTAFTATSLSPMSVDPPVVSFRLDRDPSSWPVAERVEHLGVHLLVPGQELTTRSLAGNRGWASGPFGVPIVENAVGVLLCRVARRVEAGDHTIVFGEPLALVAGDDRPMRHHRGSLTVG